MHRLGTATPRVLLGYVTRPHLPPHLPEPSAHVGLRHARQGPTLVVQVKTLLSMPPHFLPPSPGGPWSLPTDIPQVASPGSSTRPLPVFPASLSVLWVPGAEALPVVGVLPGSSVSLLPKALLLT